MLQSHLLLCSHDFYDVSVTLYNVSVTLSPALSKYTPTKWSDAQQLVEQEKQFECLPVEIRGAKKVKKCCMFCILLLIFLVQGRE